MTNDIQEIKDFESGILPFIEKFLENFKMMLNILNANIFNNDEKKLLMYDLKEIEQKLKDIIQKFKTVILELHKDTINQEANREFYSFFKDESNPNKINFLILVLSYAKLKELYNLISENLDFIKKIIVNKLSPQSIFYQQFVDFQMKTCFIKIQKLNLLLKKIEIIIHFNKLEQKSKKIYDLVNYSPRINYTYSLIFKEDLESYINSFFPIQKDNKDNIEEKKQDSKKHIVNNIEINKKILHQEIDVSRKSYIKNNKLDTSGKFLWNSSVYYYLSYDIEKLKKEEAYFINVFYMDTHLGASQEIVRSKIIRTYIRKDKILSKEEAIKKYEVFLNSLFNLNKEVIYFNFKIPEENKSLFLYHLGPLAFFHMNKQYLSDLHTGSIHQILSYEKNIIRKIIPYEFIKKYLFHWWIENVLNFVNEDERNDFNKYKILNSYIQKKIFQIQLEFKKQFPQEIDNYNNPVFFDFLKQKIGNINIVLIQRYLNIFKHYKLE